MLGDKEPKSESKDISDAESMIDLLCDIDQENIKLENDKKHESKK